MALLLARRKRTVSPLPLMHWPQNDAKHLLCTTLQKPNTDYTMQDIANDHVYHNAMPRDTP